MTKTDRPTCATCPLFKESNSTCHRFAPVRLPRRFAEGATASTRIRDEALLWGWPHTEPDEFCGEHHSCRFSLCIRPSHIDILSKARNEALRWERVREEDEFWAEVGRAMGMLPA